MTIIKELSYGVKRIKSILVTIFNKLENYNNAEFSSNGEDTFLDSFLETLTLNTVILDVETNIGDHSDIENFQYSNYIVLSKEFKNG
jgi:hypothetical protein